MDRIIHNFDPFIFHITDTFGPRWYALPYIGAAVLIYLFLLSAAKKNEVANLTPERVETFVLWLAFGVLLGARFFHVFVFEYANYGFDPVRWIQVWRGGLAFHGGFIGAVTVAWFLGSRWDIPLYSFTDRMVVPIAIALGFGRVANFVNGEMPGTPYEGPLCVDYSQSQYLPVSRRFADCRHPTQLYEMTKNWLIAAALWTFSGRALRRPGLMTWSFIGAYGLVRFFLMFVRDEERVVGDVLTLSQFFSGVMALAGAAMVFTVLRGPEPPAPRPATRPAESRSARRARTRGKRQK